VVVVLDPDPHAAVFYGRRLGQYAVRGAPTAAEALALARATGAHALLVPPGAAGEETAWHERWTRLAAASGVRVVGCAVPSDRHLAQTIGLADFLVKPVTRETLLGALRVASPHGRTIALVDDDPQLVRMLGRMLRADDRRWQVYRAYDGEEGLSLVRRTRPDVVVLDLLLPRLDGLALLEAIRGDPLLESTTVVALSARDAAEVLPSGDVRTLTLVTEAGLTGARAMRAVQALLDALPPPVPPPALRVRSAGPLAPAMVPGPGTTPASGGAPAESRAS
jgi:DNA-binding response OmpR family regulator